MSDLPKFEDWSVAAVHLLRGVIYSDDEKTWNLLLTNVSTLEHYFGRIGLRLIVDEPEGLAYLRQLADGESAGGYEALPKLFRATRLSYGQTLLVVLLRDELRRFEEADVHNERCVIEQTALFDQWKSFFTDAGDEVKLNRDLTTALRKLERLGFVRNFAKGAWEIRRILKARVPADELEGLREQLAAAAAASSEKEGTA